MPVPAEIRQVPRPKNTVVVETKNSETKRYAVRERKEVIYCRGENPKPRNGRVIGHIWGGKFHPVIKTKAKKQLDPELKVEQKYSFPLEYGLDALLHQVSKDLFDDLADFFDIDDAAKMITIAMLRVKEAGITNGQLCNHYPQGFIKTYYPEQKLSKNTITNFLNKIGKDASSRLYFLRARLSKVLPNHRLIIDGMLKNNDSTVNDLSALSRKSAILNRQHLNVMYALDVDLGEPVCVGIYPGNATDASVFGRFVQESGVKRGMIIADKGFNVKAIQKELNDYSDLAFLIPIKKNDRRIAKFNLLKIDHPVKGFDPLIMGKKVQISDDRFLYAFRDTSRSLMKTEGLFRKILKDQMDVYDTDEIVEAFLREGVIIFESNQNLSLQEIFKAYSQRWQIELIFKHYKNEICLNTTRVQSEAAVIGSEFINFLATIMSSRLIKRFDEAKLLDKYTYGTLVKALKSIRRMVTSTENPRIGDGFWDFMTKDQEKILVSLGLADISLEEELIKNRAPKKRGRKKTKPEFVGPKRPRGRPKSVGS